MGRFVETAVKKAVTVPYWAWMMSGWKAAISLRTLLHSFRRIAGEVRAQQRANGA